MATYAELQAQIEKLQAEAEKVRKDEMSAAIAQIKSLMKEHGISLEDLGGVGKKERQGGSANAKYCDPATGTTWSGRGQAPKWMKDYVNAGRSKEEFLIKT